MPSLIQKLWRLSPASAAEFIARRLRPAPASQRAWVKVRRGPLQGHELLLDTPDAPPWKEMADGEYDGFFFETLNKAGSLQGAVIWDIGTHFGYNALSFAALVGDGGQVLAFEPNPANYAHLQQHLRRNPILAKRIKAFPKAVSITNGETEFTFSSNLASGESSCSYVKDSVTPFNPDHYGQFEKRVVPTVSLPSIQELGDGRPPKVIKIDVEGAEQLVLEGGRQFLAQHRPFLFIEVHHIRLLFYIQPLLIECGYKLALAGEEHSAPSRCFLWASPA